MTKYRTLNLIAENHVGAARSIVDESIESPGFHTGGMKTLNKYIIIMVAVIVT